MTDHLLSLTSEERLLNALDLLSKYPGGTLGISAQDEVLKLFRESEEAHERQRRQVAALLKKIRALERPFSFNEGRRPDWERSWTCDWCNAGWADTPNVTHPVNDCLWVQAHAPDVLAEAARLGLGETA